MKKLLILIVIALLTVLTLLTMLRGIQIGSLQILGIQGMKEKNEKLDEQITQATKLASTDYPKAYLQLESSNKELQKQKQTYEDMTAVSTDSQVEQASQLTKYELEKLDIQLEGHAKSEGVDLTMAITSSNTVSDAYNLNFTVSGKYIGVTDFIADIEDDPVLGFKIENFSMVSDGADSVQATFICRDIMINGITTESVQTETTTDNENNTNSTNTTNTTGGNSTSNTTSNSTNTTNATNSSNSTR